MAAQRCHRKGGRNGRVVKQAVETIKRMYNLSLLKLLERLPVSNGGTGAAG